MKRQNKRRIEDRVIDGAIGVAYGTGTLVGSYFLFHLLPYISHQDSDEEQRFNEVTNPLNNMITLGGLLTKEEVSQAYSSIETLKELDLRDESETQLNGIFSKLDIINSIPNLENSVEQSQVRRALVGVSDQLQGIRELEHNQAVDVATTSLMLGAALLVVCGYGAIKSVYNAIKGGCGAIKEGYKAIFP